MRIRFMAKFQTRRFLKKIESVQCKAALATTKAMKGSSRMK